MRRRQIGRVTVALVLAVMLLIGPAAAALPLLPAITFTTTGMNTNNSVDSYNPELDGRLVAWEEFDGADWDVKVRSVAPGSLTVTIPGAGNQENPDVSGDWIVYQDDSSGDYDIKLYHFGTGLIRTIEDSDHNEINPRFDGNIVVWQADETDLCWYRDLDLTDPADTHEAEQLTFAAADVLYDVDNGRIAWVDLSTDRLYISTVRPKSAPPWPMVADYADDVYHLQIHGDQVALQFESGGDYDSRVYNIATHQTTDIATDDAVWEGEPSVFHNTFAWRAGNSTSAYNVRYRRPNHAISTITDVESEQTPSLYGHRIAYESYNNVDDFDIWLATGDAKLAARTYGANRYATAAAVSAAYFADASNIVLCTGENFPDALSAAPLARALDAPLLLTRKASLPAETLAEIQRLAATAPTNIYVIGSEAAISKAVYDQLDATYSVERIYGANRYETSAKIAQRVKHLMGDLCYRGFFARGDNFPDALAVGPVAAGACGPILLVQPNAVPSAVANMIDTINLTAGVVIGDTNSVSAATASAINARLGSTASRWSGSNRYETAVAVIEGGLRYRWIDLDTLGVAVGTKFPDALGGGAALGYYGSALVLTNGSSLSPATGTFLDNHAYEIGRLDAFGDTNSVSSSTYAAIQAKVK